MIDKSCDNCFHLTAPEKPRAVVCFECDSTLSEHKADYQALEAELATVKKALELAIKNMLIAFYAGKESPLTIDQVADNYIAEIKSRG